MDHSSSENSTSTSFKQLGRNLSVNLFKKAAGDDVAKADAVAKAKSDADARDLELWRAFEALETGKVDYGKDSHEARKNIAKLNVYRLNAQAALEFYQKEKEAARTTETNLKKNALAWWKILRASLSRRGILHFLPNTVESMLPTKVNEYEALTADLNIFEDKYDLVWAGADLVEFDPEFRKNEVESTAALINTLLLVAVFTLAFAVPLLCNTFSYEEFVEMDKRFVVEWNETTYSEFTDSHLVKDDMVYVPSSSFLWKTWWSLTFLITALFFGCRYAVCFNSVQPGDGTQP